MKNKIMLGMTVVAIAAVAASNAHLAHRQDGSLSALNLVNVDALAHDGDDDKEECDYAIRTGYTYYDCGNCHKKVYDEQGKGHKSKCFF